MSPEQLGRLNIFYASCFDISIGTSPSPSFGDLWNRVLSGHVQDTLFHQSIWALVLSNRASYLRIGCLEFYILIA